MRILKQKFPKFIDINTFDFTPYGRELTREEAYLVNGGQVMSQSDQYAMAQTNAKGDQETMDTKVIYTPQSIKGTHTYSKLSYALIEGVGFVAESIKQGYFLLMKKINYP